MNSPSNMQWIYNDGGRAAAGYKGTTGDCVTRAIAIATNKPYQEVYDAINKLALLEKPRGKNRRSNARTGVGRFTYDRYLKGLGWTWHPTMTVGSGCKVHLKRGELPAHPSKWLIVRVSKHVTCVVNNFIFDTYDPSRDHGRCVYGYYSLDK